jgi:hypothetical protein
MVVIKGSCKELYKIIGYRPLETERVEITESNGHSWNGWVQVYSNNRLVYSSFKTGIHWEICEHILACPECRKSYSYDELLQIRKSLGKIVKEWNELMGNKFRLIHIIFGWQ